MYLSSWPLSSKRLEVKINPSHIMKYGNLPMNNDNINKRKIRPPSKNINNHILLPFYILNLKILCFLFIHQFCIVGHYIKTWFFICWSYDNGGIFIHNITHIKSFNPYELRVLYSGSILGVSTKTNYLRTLIWSSEYDLVWVYCLIFRNKYLSCFWGHNLLLFFRTR